MKGSSFAAAVGFLSAPIANAGGTVQWDIQKHHHPIARSGKRDTSTYYGDISNDISSGGYFASCTLGTPRQNMTLLLDTGSSDVWVPGYMANLCEECPSFNSSDSSTFIDIGEGDFDIAYVDGSYSKGDYFKDTFEIAGATVSNLTMGLGTNTTLTYGVVGVGYKYSEAIVETESLSSAYPNLPLAMVNQGLIATNAYSLWLNDLDASTGSILFGGIDTEKYTGDLIAVDIIENSESHQYDTFLVNFTSIQAISESGTDELTSREFPVEVVLDSGTTLSYIPTDLAEQMWTEVGALYVAEVDLALVPCNMRKSEGSFTFEFAGSTGPRVNLTMDELVRDLVITGPAPTFSSGEYRGEDACVFGIQNSSSYPYLLGDTFLRSAYVVYDLVNNQIAIAQTDFNGTGSNIVPFESNGAHIPSATMASNQSLATATSTVTEPTYAAASGFMNGTSVGSMMVSPSGEHLAVVGVAMLMSLFGGGLFLA
ncbi:putative aspartic-type endopeptidase OPSB [Cytospora mali]|uniref:Aspartic-type endopeptidase OPSB n=1 Tax=Cytospora mali TaxID=578113 RepID=A0A194V445_CYTMA|nr:putative aspartic-type endopeptidase OPSB [Valsa mali var. pyri (nom. inval.)]